MITDQNHDDDFENMLHTILNEDDEKGPGDINHGAVTPSTNLDGDIAKIVSTQSADMNPSSTLDEDAEEGSRDGQDSTDDSAAGGEEDIAKSTSVQSADMDPLDGVEDDDGQQQVIGQESSTAKWLYEICARVQSPLPTLQLSHAVHSAIQTGRQDVSKMQASLFELFGEGEQNVKILFEVMEKADAIRLVTKVDLNKIAKEKWGAGLGLEFSAAGVSTSHTTQVPASHNDGLRTQETDPQSDPQEMAEEGRAIETPPPPAASSKNTEGAKGSLSFPWSDKRDNFIIAALLFVVAGLVAAVVYIALSHWAVTTNGDSGGVATTNQNGNEAILDGPQTFPYPPSPVPLSSSWAPTFNSTQRLAEICPTYIGTIFDPDFNRSCGDTIIEADGNSLFVNKCGISYFVRSDGGSVALNSAPLSDVSVSDEFFLLGFSESNSNGTGAQLFVMEPTSMYNFPIILSDLGDLNLPTKVDIDQDVMAIAVPGDGQNQGGYVFIYRKSNISSIVPLATKLAWIQEAKLTPNPLNLYEFGDTIVVKQNLVMVGDRRYAAGKGAVFVYEFDSASSLWKGAQDASPLLSNDCSYSFGKSLAVTNDGELLIGCGGDRKFQKEAVYFYSRSNTGNFVLGQQVVISARDACPHCGKGKIELDGDSAIMAVATSYSSSYAGGLYFFTQTSGSWKEAAAIDIPSDEEGWRSDFAFLNNTFLISTQRNVHKYTLGDCSPTNQPTSQPTNEAERKLCFETNDRLKSAVDEYIGQDCYQSCYYNTFDCSNYNDCNVARQYGWPINSWCVSEVTDMSDLFSVTDTSFNGDISNWDTSNVLNMDRMFSGATSFNGDISNWDTSSVLSMAYMFKSAASFNGDISNWDVSSVSSTRAMFFKATAFNGDISNWDTSSVLDTTDMFRYAFSFNSDISNWDVSNVLNIAHMFSDATSFNQNLCGWGDIFPYANVWTSLYIFARSGCAFQDDPRLDQRGPFCASSCASKEEELWGQGQNEDDDRHQSIFGMTIDDP